MTDSTTSRALDRALTLGGVGRHGELSEVTRGIYAHWYGRAAAWKRSETGSSVRTFTPEQVAQYALWLVEQGYARSTAGLAVRAIRWFHRVAGEPVPDGLPAYVLLSGHSTPGNHDAVNDLDAPASRDPLDLLAAMTAVCKPREPKGCRDLAIINLIYAGGFTTERLSELNLRDADRGSLDDVLRHDTGPGHYPSMCAPCTVLAWYTLVCDRLVTYALDAPLFRAVDKGGNVAGTGDPYAGQHAGTGRLGHKSISRKVLRPIAVEAGLLDIAPAPARALRLAGASADYLAGDINLVQAARRAGYTPNSALMLRHLLDLTAPARREDAP